MINIASIKRSQFSLTTLLLGAVFLILAPMFIAGMFFINGTRKVKVFLLSLLAVLCALTILLDVYRGEMFDYVSDNAYWFGVPLYMDPTSRIAVILMEFLAGIAGAIGWNSQSNRDKNTKFYLIAGLLLIVSNVVTASSYAKQKAMAEATILHLTMSGRDLSFMREFKEKNPDVDMTPFREKITRQSKEFWDTFDGKKWRTN